MKVKYSELEAWKEQVVKEQMTWAKGKASDADLNAYKAGLCAGMREIISVLMFQGKIQIDYNS